MWTLQEARILCEQVEEEFNRITLGAHVALGGSCLYRGSSEKDVDLFIYPHKSTVPPQEAHVISALSSIGFKFVSERPHEKYGDDKRVLQFEYQEKRVDVFMMFPAGGVWSFSGVGAPTMGSVLMYENTPDGWLRARQHPPTLDQLQRALLAGIAEPPPPTVDEIERATRTEAEWAMRDVAVPAYHGALGPPLNP